MKQVERDIQGWWFWDEEHINRFGPFRTEGDCRRERRAYLEFVNGGDEPEHVSLPKKARIRRASASKRT